MKSDYLESHHKGFMDRSDYDFEEVIDKMSKVLNVGRSDISIMTQTMVPNQVPFHLKTEIFEKAGVMLYDKWDTEILYDLCWKQFYKLPESGYQGVIR